MFEIALDVTMTASRKGGLGQSYQLVLDFFFKTKTFVSDPGFSIEQRATSVSP